MRSILIALVLLCSASVHAQETTIRVLGAHVGFSLSTAQMTTQLRNIVTAWNESGLPSAVQLLNGGEPVHVDYPNMPVPIIESLTKAYGAEQLPRIMELRNKYKADVIIIFREPGESGGTVCGANRTHFTSGVFLPSNGLDLNSKDTGFIAILNPGCDLAAAAHEFGHLLSFLAVKEPGVFGVMEPASAGIPAVQA
jgi:hypothetical protein